MRDVIKAYKNKRMKTAIKQGDQIHQAVGPIG